MEEEIISLLKQCRDMLMSISSRNTCAKVEPTGIVMSFSELAREYLDYSKSKVKPSTLAAYENLLLSSPFAKSLSSRDVSTLTRSAVQLWIDSFDEHTSYIHNFVIVMRSMFSWAHDRELCALPEEYSKPFKFKRMVRKGGGKEISDCDYDKIVRRLTEDMSKGRMYAAVFVALRTGMRIGEICGLSRDDVDAEKNVIRIRRTLKRIYSPVSNKTEIVVGTPKSKSSLRDIPVPRSVIETCLLHDQNGETLFNTEPRSLLDFFKRFQRRCGCENIYSFHSLRHTFVSREIRAGKNPKAVSRYVGHGKLDITLAVYTHVSENDLKEVVNV